MKEITQFENFRLEIWRRPRQRTINLRVRPDGGLRVTCARLVPRREIFQFIDEQRDFIARCLKQIESHRARHPLRKFETGEQFLYLGERIPLDVIWSWDPKVRVRLDLYGVEMVAALKSRREERREALHRAYQRQARTLLKKRVAYWSQRMGLQPSSLSVRGQRTRWGSCTAAGKVSLNWKLLAAPSHVIDYVVIHELAHLRHLNHSTRFWDLVSEHCAEYREAKRWLRENEAEIAAQFEIAIPNQEKM